MTSGAGHQRVNIVQGEYFVSDDPDLVITTLLGSCVAACLHDPLAGVGGMNHFLLPGQMGRERQPAAERAGVHLMELLVNGLLKLGAGRDRLQAKLFGGAKTMIGLADIGAANAAFARQFLSWEGIPVVASSLGGTTGRRIQFWPATGRARQNFMAGQVSETFTAAMPAPPSAGELELF